MLHAIYRGSWGVSVSITYIHHAIAFESKNDADEGSGKGSDT